MKIETGPPITHLLVNMSISQLYSRAFISYSGGGAIGWRGVRRKQDGEKERDVGE